MLTLKQIRDNREFVIERLKVKGVDAEATLTAIIAEDESRKKFQSELDTINAQLNSLAKEIGMLFKQGKKEEADVLKAKTGELKELSKEHEAAMVQSMSKLNALVVSLPNIPHISVPEGKSAEHNELVRQNDIKVELPEGAVPHWELAKKYDIIDFELGNKLTGAGFPVYKGAGAAIQRALISFFLAENIAAGYYEVMPPLMVNEASGFGTGQLPDKEGQMYHDAQDNLYLIPTAEVPVTNIYRDEIVAESSLPIALTAYTPCFRREAGSYGKDVRGLNRLHQFDKVEIVRIEHPENSYAALDKMVLHVEKILQKLGLPYRILRLCGGDISFTSALTFDFEVYSAAQEMWLEVSSVSNFESFQANRLKLRYKSSETKKTELAHTLNGSSLALPRTLAAILENNQTAEGIRIPEVLRPFMGGVEFIK